MGGPVKPNVGLGMLLLGPSGTGKSHMVLSALEAAGSGVVLCCPGADEMLSYRKLFDQASEPVWNDDGSVTIQDTPYLFVPIDDEGFYPSLKGKDKGKPSGMQKAVTILRAVSDIQRSEKRYGVLAVDTFTGVNDLAVNVMLDRCSLTEPPGGRSPEGAQFYGGIAILLNQFARACRPMKAMGAHWICTGHVVMRDVSETYSGEQKSARTQQVALFTGAFRERVGAMFDIVAYMHVDKEKEYMMQVEADARQKAKGRVLHADTPHSIANTWQELAKWLD